MPGYWLPWPGNSQQTEGWAAARRVSARDGSRSASATSAGVVAVDDHDAAVPELLAAGLRGARDVGQVGVR
ncbi:hypothetical protein [Salinispora arenicola]|uniref:hypothetical protein n=1 Tax=Salinispora arenicola TaxID=168697 RepID=UPI0027DC34E5|nr:hypothetical protein [Salinispora arenicola]